MLNAVDACDHLAARDVDELLGVGMVVLTDLVAGLNLRHTHEARSRSNGLRTEQDPYFASASRVGRTVLDCPDSDALSVHIASRRLRGDDTFRPRAEQWWRPACVPLSFHGAMQRQRCLLSRFSSALSMPSQ